MSKLKLSERMEAWNDGRTGELFPGERDPLGLLGHELIDWIREVAVLEAKLEEPARCNSGHETLPLKLWTCPTCYEELERKLHAVYGLSQEFKEVTQKE